VVKQVAEAENTMWVLQEAVYINPKHDITRQGDQGAQRREVRGPVTLRLAPSLKRSA
jgi:hypothetical protein